MHAYRDYWGSTVTAFDTHGPHTELVVQATSVVEARASAEDWPEPTVASSSTDRGRGVVSVITDVAACEIRALMQEVRDAMAKVLDGTSLADLRSRSAAAEAILLYDI